MVQVADKDPRIHELELLRRKMTKVALEKGLSSAESVKISQQLDALLNEVQKDKPN
ncbi:stage 0 sporulation regulatory protein [Halobacillus karajensis]|uniref:Spo0E like sporulation regulatory protein n=1 Tax=Halobacillus karajensis TaxID=195088 RepID=A0A024P2A1_9BACI|nr:aspartyl-phosphate phosphatase Spo0E family protein [Halobacillus karajensis]CDQ19944.1 Spo0E like sporulation regulatory protein [Halobacillus karajensis]CDQ22404.1 Spo0E like sporulation regulatory protein [Halobacillus karajensis]CDQ28247.1 Spo0E like sporulation regulatory protein [Halobacillus karajensis]SEH69421.1 stage 0 sporulation regulatory protein [Halobacillus karajensis]